MWYCVARLVSPIVPKDHVTFTFKSHGVQVKGPKKTPQPPKMLVTQSFDTPGKINLT